MKRHIPSFFHEEKMAVNEEVLQLSGSIVLRFTTSLSNMKNRLNKTIIQVTFV
jgi:hypothetical protein